MVAVMKARSRFGDGADCYEGVTREKKANDFHGQTDMTGHGTTTGMTTTKNTNGIVIPETYVRLSLENDVGHHRLTSGCIHLPVFANVTMTVHTGEDED